MKNSSSIVFLRQLPFAVGPNCTISRESQTMPSMSGWEKELVDHNQSCEEMVRSKPEECPFCGKEYRSSPYIRKKLSLECGHNCCQMCHFKNDQSCLTCDPEAGRRRCERRLLREKEEASIGAHQPQKPLSFGASGVESYSTGFASSLRPLMSASSSVQSGGNRMGKCPNCERVYGERYMFRKRMLLCGQHHCCQKCVNAYKKVCVICAQPKAANRTILERGHFGYGYVESGRRPAASHLYPGIVLDSSSRSGIESRPTAAMHTPPLPLADFVRTVLHVAPTVSNGPTVPESVVHRTVPKKVSTVSINREHTSTAKGYAKLPRLEPGTHFGVKREPVSPWKQVVKKEVREHADGETADGQIVDGNVGYVNWYSNNHAL